MALGVSAVTATGATMETMEETMPRWTGGATKKMFAKLELNGNHMLS